MISHARSDRGQAVPLLLAAVVVAGSLLVGVAHLAVTALDAARARAAADATALAVASSGPTSGAAVAAANHASIVSVVRGGDDVVVTVRVGRAQATARAETYLSDA